MSAPDWLCDELISGLQKLFALRLANTPPQDAIVGTAEVWIEAAAYCGIQWSEPLDRHRVQRAFRTLFRACERWPVPRQLLDNLGPRDPPPALPPPALSPEQIERNRRRVRELVATWSNKKTLRTPQ